MAQPIRPAEIQMDLVSQGEMSGMRRTSAPPGSEILLDPTSNPMMSNQPFRQAQHAEQNVRNRQQDAMGQYMADNERQSDEAIRQMSAAQQKASDLKRETVAMILDGGNAPATAMLFSDKGLTEKVTRDAMQQRAIGERLSPDLADYSGQLMA